MAFRKSNKCLEIRCGGRDVKGKIETLSIGGLNWPVLINAEQVCRVMVDLRNNIELGLRCVLDCIKAINRRIKVRKRVSCCFRITGRSERKNSKCWNKRSSGWC